jgi:hypothetical protein
MAGTGSAHNYFGIQVTLTGGTTAQNLLSLLQAIEPTVPPSVRTLFIQADNAVSGTLHIGDAQVSTTRYGIAQIIVGSPTTSLTPQEFSTGGSIQAIPLLDIYLVSSASMKVNVLGFC